MDLQQHQEDINSRTTEPQQPMPTPDTPGLIQEAQTSNKHSNKKLIIAIVVAVVMTIILGSIVLIALIIASNQVSHIGGSKESPHSSEVSSTKITKVNQGVTTVEVTHPSTWTVLEKPNEFNLPDTTITSPKGNNLSIKGNLGYGGDCTPDNYTFTLTQKIATSTPGLYFSEYTTTAPDYPESGIGIDTTDFNIENKDVGSSGTDVCSSKIGYYTMVGKLGDSENELNVSIISKKANQRVTRYSDISDDPEFISMIKSLKVTVNE